LCAVRNHRTIKRFSAKWSAILPENMQTTMEKMCVWIILLGWWKWIPNRAVTFRKS
jgi:hypothetical protein